MKFIKNETKLLIRMIKCKVCQKKIFLWQCKNRIWRVHFKCIEASRFKSWRQYKKDLKERLENYEELREVYKKKRENRHG